MKIIGIICEYNPFHLGHLYHIEESRRLDGEDSAIVCVMSGDFVQRGEAAVFSKFARAEAAVRCGADLVFELPLPWALSSAEGFARGGVGLLGSLGVVTHLSFGSESGNLEPLQRLAEALLHPSVDERIKPHLETGIPYAAARQKVMEEELGELAEHMKTPNNILAVEYLKAIYDLGLDIQPMTIPRKGAGHDMPGRDAYRSASELRAMLRAGMEVDEFIPPAAAEIYRREAEQGRGPVKMEDLETALLSRLRFSDKERFERAPDASEGLGNRLYRCARMEPTLDAVYSAAKTKRYAMSRLRRMTMCVALGITAEMSAGIPPYARLLAATEKGRELLREIGERSLMPVVTKPASIKKLDAASRELFELGSAAHDLYVLGYAVKQERRGGRDWTNGPIIC